MSNVAILIDGGFFQKMTNSLWGQATPEERANQLMAYCKRHLTKRDHLYRIFYYDCPPSTKIVYHPLLQRTINLGRTDEFTWMTSFLEEMKNKRKVALRLGRLSETGLTYNLKPEITKKLCAGTLTVDQLTETAFTLSIVQKGVDMKLGVDIASVAYKKQVNKIFLIAGDSDFVPAAKLARREGIDFVLDPMGHKIADDLAEHIDGIVTPRFDPHLDSLHNNDSDESDPE